MTFKEVMDQIITWLQQDQRISYRALKRQFALEDDYLADLKVELIEVKQVAVDQDGQMLVWRGDTASTAASVPPGPPQHAPLAYTPSYLVEKILTSRSALEGERKQVTVLFADLKGSMELLADRDPEEARQLLDPVLERMMEAVHRYEGTVNQVMGDGIMALFGAPLAHEEHAMRACYAALAMQESVTCYGDALQRSQGVPIQIRVGLNSGEVVVRAIGSDLHMDYTAVGQTTHLAARMEQMAKPGSILITTETLRLAEGYIRATPLGPVPIKGLDALVEVFELVGASGIRRRLQATAARGLTRFVGRDTEFAALVQAVERAGAGHGQVVAVVGEAGVGKSRLAYEFLHSHYTQGWRVLESVSVSYGKATPYFPVIDLLKRYSHVEEHDDTRTIRAKVTGQVLTLDPALQDTIPALLALLDTVPGESPFLTLDPPQRRQRTLDALKRVLLRESQEQPLLLVCEDLHWIDTETQALLDSLVESLPTARLLLLVTYRPEYQHGWGSKTYYTQVRLDPLPPASAVALLHALLGDDPGLEPPKRLLIARTEGNPFFLEESVRALVETGVLVGVPGAYCLAQALPTIQVPATVQAVLAARIDRLPPAEKHLLQTAAVIGTDVPGPLVQAIADLPDEALHRGLAHLQAAELLYETHLFPECIYTFKHALTHEVAYGSLLHERRRALHARIVEAFEALAGDRLAEQTDRLAHHALRGEVWEKAVLYCRQAGAKAMTRSAYQEAAGYFEQALGVLPHLPETRATHEQAIELRLDLRHALHPLGEYERVLAYLGEAEILAEALHDRRRLGWAAALKANCCLMLGDTDQAVAPSRRAFTLASDLGEVDLRIMANFYLGQISHVQGDYRQAIGCFRENVEALQGALMRANLGGTALSSVTARTWLVLCLAELGAFAEARTYTAEAVELAEAADHSRSRLQAYYGVGFLSLYTGALDMAISALARSLALCQSGALPGWFSDIAAALGAAYTLCGRVGEALPLLEQSLEQATAVRLRYRYAPKCIWLSEAYLLVGRVEDARARAQQALALSRSQQERGHQAYALRLLGDIAAHRDPPACAPAEASYRQALTLADELGMRPLQAHCHRGLGTLYTTSGQRDQARAALSVAIDLYRAMEMTFWLPQAEAALAQVEGR